MAKKFFQDTAYWIHKTKAFLHDPPDKAIHIPGHEERANELLNVIGINSSLTKEEYQQADIIASGMDRSNLPGYNSHDETKNGAIDFSKSPKLTHPTGANDALDIALPDLFNTPKEAVGNITKAIQELLRKDLGDNAEDVGQGLSECKEYKGNEEAFSPARFHYLFFMLRRRLSQENIGELGGLWHRLPADTRMPDHSIWQHCGLVSALASCQRLSKNNKASLMVYSLTPVQDFVGRARKLKDYWSGSILLSWLTFEGLKAVIHYLGADHIIYPSLHGQPLVDDLLQDMHMDSTWFNSGRKDHGVASFPNKFTCLVPAGQEEEVAEIIKSRINSAWQQLGEATLAMLAKKIPGIHKDAYIKKQFKRQLGSYWQHNWTAVSLVKGEDKDIISNLLHKKAIDPAFDFWQKSQQFHSSTGEGQLYSISHRLTQALLAAGKARQNEQRSPEPGIKCDLFGEFEIIHYQYREECNKNPKPSEDPFWQDLHKQWNTDTDFGKTERLCALALVKRLADRVCKTLQNHPLEKMFKAADSFPSTTEMALYDWFREVKSKAKKEIKIAENLESFNWAKDERKARRKIAECCHEESDKAATQEVCNLFKLPKIEDFHKYYGILMMDGDNMGKLINGETLGATWSSVLHPDLDTKLKNKFDPKYKKFWQDKLEKKRLVSPAVHAAISEALGDFSLYTVPAIIDKYGGCLLYAGGDDVCAILPVSTIIATAREIARQYCYSFININKLAGVMTLSNTYQPAAGDKLGLYLGTGEDISISAGIMIAHHKKPLGKVIARAHELLDRAKTEGSRNSFVLELDKRSGGGRSFGGKWHTPDSETSLLDHFLATATALQKSDDAAMSSSLAYRLTTFQDGLLALVNKHPPQLVPFIAKQLDRSILGTDNDLSPDQKQQKATRIAGHIAALICADQTKTDQAETKLAMDSLIIANFMGHCQQAATVEAHNE